MWPWLPERVVVVHMYVGGEDRVGPTARGGVRIAAAARPTRVGPRARVVLPPRGFWLLPRSEVERAEGGGRETCRPEGSLRKKRRDRRSLSGPFRGTRTIRSWVGLGLYARAATSHSVIQ